MWRGLTSDSALVQLGRHAEALDSYDKALAIAPKTAQAWFFRGDVLNKLGVSESYVPVSGGAACQRSKCHLGLFDVE